MAWTSFIPPYPNGYENGESGGTPVTAEILNTNYDAFLLALNSWAAEVGTDISNKVDKVTGKQLSDENYTSTEKTKLAGIAEGATAVVANPSESSSTNLTKIKIGGSVYLIPQGGSGGSSVSWTQIQATGTKIATITIDGVPTDVYAPNGGSGGGDSVSWTQVVQSGTKIGTITINNVATDVYVPAVPTNTSDLTNDSNFVSDSSYVHTDNNYTTTEKNKLADLVQVEANPSSGTSAGDLSSISIGGTKYDIPTGGGGGTTVIANPSGEATDELEKLQVGNTIYSIPEGGSGGGEFSKTSLFTSSTDVQNITLSDSIENYDAISIIAGYTDGGGHQRYTATYYSDTLMANAGENVNFGVTNDSTQVHFKVTDATHLVRTHQNTLIIEEILGITYGSSGSSANWKDVTGTLTAGQTNITLSSPHILTTSTLDFYTDKFGVSPTDAIVTNGSVALTFEAQSTDLAVKVRITNDEIPATPLIPKMTSNTLPSGVASASTEYNSNYYAYKAFDDNSSTLWGSYDNRSAGEWIKYDFGAGNEKKLDSFFFLNRSETNYAVGSFKFQGSNDNTNWTDLAEVTGADVNDSATVSIQKMYKNTAFRYVRWLIVSNAHGGSGTGFVGLQVNGWEV